MKKIEYDKYGGPGLMHLDEVEPPVPGKGQVLVRVLAAARQVAPGGWQCPTLIERRRRLCHLKHRKPGLRPRVPRP